MEGELSDTPMDKPCDICGHVDYKDADLIMTCSQCCSTREHIYCMKKNLSEIADTWICEACLSIDNTVPPKYDREEEFVDSFGVFHQEIVYPGPPGKVCTDPGRQISSKKLKGGTGKVKFLPTEEAIRLSTGTLKLGSPERFTTKLKYGLSSSIRPMSRRTLIPSNIIPPKLSSPGVKENPKVTSSAFMKPATHTGAKINFMLGRRAVKTSKESEEGSGGEKCPVTRFMPGTQDETLKEQMKEVQTVNNATSRAMYRRPYASATSMRSVCFKEAETSYIEREKAAKNTSPLHVQPMTGSGQTSDVAAEAGNFSEEERDLKTFRSKAELYLQHRPSLEATWMGGFKLFDTATLGSFYGGFLAQPSRSIPREVFEFLKKLPKILQVKLLPRDHLCADLFGSECPDFNDIALYFYPSANIERSKQNYSCLSEILETQSSVMICYFDGVELLILTSKQLHIDSQSVIARLDRKHFLWGVLREVKAEHVLQESHNELASLVSTMDNVEAIDMDVDMEGARVVGPVDVVVSKALSRKEFGSHDKGDVNFTRSYEKVQLKINSHLSKRKLVNALADAERPPGFKKISKLNSRTVPKEAGLVGGWVTNQMVKENISLQEEQRAAFEASCSQLQRSPEVSKLTSQKHHNADCPPALKKISPLNSEIVKEEAQLVDGGVINHKVKENISLQGVPRAAFEAFSPQLQKSIEESILTSQKHDAVCPLRLKKITQPDSGIVKEVAQLVDAGVINHMVKENITLQDVPGTHFEASSPQLQTSEESKLTSQKHHKQEPGWNEPDDPPAAFSPPSTENGIQRGVNIKAEVSEDETICTTSRKKRHLEIEVKVETNITICWMPPLKEWVKLNIDGSSSGVLDCSGAGGVVRDDSGKWLLGYSKNLGISTSLASDLWALFSGLKLVWERGYRKVLVDSVSHEVVKCLEQPTAFLDPNRALIQSCRDFLHRNWDCILQCIHREANVCAHWLATHCDHLPLGSLVIYNTPPYSLLPILQKDSTGIIESHPR